MKLAKFFTWIGIVALGAVAVLEDLFGPHQHAHGHEEGGGLLSVPGFYAWFGLVGCLLIVIVSKALGKAGLMRSEDYYNRSGGSS